MDFSTPESVRHPAVKTPEALAFIAAAEGLNYWTKDNPAVDEFSIRLITNGTLYDAQTIYLNELAAF